MIKNFKRLYVVTGKGGVGKTSCSVALTAYLNHNNRKAKLIYFNSSKLDQKISKDDEVQRLAKSCEVEAIKLDLAESCQKYMAMKLKSSTVSSWIIKTPFFKSLINMIPGFSYLIYLGQILDDLQNDPELIYVLDSPSSGHALTMFEATKNFSKIFSSGILYQDTQTMLKLLHNDDYLKINILSLPSYLSLTESKELKSQLNELEFNNIEIIGNNTLLKYENLNLPEVLKLKIENEARALADNDKIMPHHISFSSAQNSADIVKELLPSMQYLV